ncbi:MAG: hypothetical protein WKG07_36165 [Hymenobacter sp.]
MTDVLNVRAPSSTAQPRPGSTGRGDRERLRREGRERGGRLRPSRPSRDRRVLPRPRRTVRARAAGQDRRPRAWRRLHGAARCAPPPACRARNPGPDGRAARHPEHRRRGDRHDRRSGWSTERISTSRAPVRARPVPRRASGPRACAAHVGEDVDDAAARPRNQIVGARRRRPRRGAPGSPPPRAPATLSRSDLGSSMRRRPTADSSPMVLPARRTRAWRGTSARPSSRPDPRAPSWSSVCWARRSTSHQSAPRCGRPARGVRKAGLRARRRRAPRAGAPVLAPGWRSAKPSGRWPGSCGKDILRTGEAPAPGSPSDVLVSAGIACRVAALGLLVGGRGVGGGALVETAMLALAGRPRRVADALGPYVADGHLSMTGRGTQFAYAAEDIAVAALLLRGVLWRRRRDPTLDMLALGMCAYLAADIAWNWLTLVDSYVAGAWFDLGWLLFSVLVEPPGCAARPSWPRLQPPSTSSLSRRGRPARGRR